VLLKAEDLEEGGVRGDGDYCLINTRGDRPSNPLIYLECTCRLSSTCLKYCLRNTKQ